MASGFSHGRPSPPAAQRTGLRAALVPSASRRIRGGQQVEPCVIFGQVLVPLPARRRERGLNHEMKIRRENDAQCLACPDLEQAQIVLNIAVKQCLRHTLQLFAFKCGSFSQRAFAVTRHIEDILLFTESRYPPRYQRQHCAYVYLQNEFAGCR